MRKIFDFFQGLGDPVGRGVRNSLRDEPVFLQEPVGEGEPINPDEIILLGGSQWVNEGTVRRAGKYGLGASPELINQFEDENGGSTRWGLGVFTKIYSPEEFGSWSNERGGYLMGYVDKKGVMNVVDVLWISEGERGTTDLLTRVGSEGGVTEDRVSQVRRGVAEWNLIADRVGVEGKVGVVGWYHDHPPPESGEEATNPTPGLGDLSTSMVMMPWVEENFPGRKPIMLIGQKGRDRKIRIALWRMERDDQSTCTYRYQPGVITRYETAPEISYWPLPEGSDGKVSTETTISLDEEDL